MGRFVGVTLPHFAFPALKRNALLFEQIAIFELPGLIRLCQGRAEYQGNEGIFVARTLEWLEEQGVILGVSAESLGPMSAAATPKAEAFRNEVNEAMERFIKRREEAGVPVMAEELASGELIADVMARALALALQDRMDLDAVPAIPPHGLVNRIVKNSEALDRVAHVVLGGLPVPDESTSWESILEFRWNPDSKSKLSGLRRRMKQAATTPRETSELEQELEWLLHEYEEHMRLHRMKVNKGSLEVVVTLAAELVEDVAKLRLRNAAGLLFERRRREIALLEAERSAPGRELAYISKAKAAFGT